MRDAKRTALMRKHFSLRCAGAVNLPPGYVWPGVREEDADRAAGKEWRAGLARFDRKMRRAANASDFVAVEVFDPSVGTRTDHYAYTRS